MTTLDPIYLIILVLFAANQIQRRRDSREIVLTPDKFWSLVRSQTKPIVLFTTKGFLIKRLHYVFPYQGILFYTPAEKTEAPDGVTLIGTGDSFSS